MSLSSLQTDYMTLDTSTRSLWRISPNIKIFQTTAEIIGLEIQFM